MFPRARPFAILTKPTRFLAFALKKPPPSASPETVAIPLDGVSVAPSFPPKPCFEFWRQRPRSNAPVLRRSYRQPQRVDPREQKTTRQVWCPPPSPFSAFPKFLFAPESAPAPSPSPARRLKPRFERRRRRCCFQLRFARAEPPLDRIRRFSESTKTTPPKFHSNVSAIRRSPWRSYRLEPPPRFAGISKKPPPSRERSFPDFAKRFSPSFPTAFSPSFPPISAAPALTPQPAIRYFSRPIRTNPSPERRYCHPARERLEPVSPARERRWVAPAPPANTACAVCPERWKFPSKNRTTPKFPARVSAFPPIRRLPACGRDRCALRTVFSPAIPYCGARLPAPAA